MSIRVACGACVGLPYCVIIVTHSTRKIQHVFCSTDCSIMEKYISVKDLEEAAAAVLPKAARDYIKSGATDEETLANNKQAFRRLRIRPKCLVGVTACDLRTTALQQEVSMPVGISPTALQKMAHSDGELANAKAAEAEGTIYTLSTISTSSIEEVAQAAPNAIKWFQLYIYKDSITKLPIIAKGVLRGDDAKKAVAAGCDAILVSNHGARQLDGVPATIEALPEIVEAVKDTKVEVYLDGGVTTGTDVYKALALGAKMVFVGRPALWGLTVGGQAGVQRMLSIFRTELEYAFQIAGTPRVHDITSDMVRHENMYSKL